MVPGPFFVPQANPGSHCDYGSNTARTLATDLDGREKIIVHRRMNPEDVLKQVRTERCFVIGGSRTFSRFASYLTHVYLTVHPVVFSSGSLPLFSTLESDMALEFITMVDVDGPNGIYQFQYKVMAP